MAAAGPLRVERDGPLLRITLARPERRNALDAELIAALTAAFADVGDARAVVLAGEGDSFCAGADVEWMRASAELSYEENVADSTRLRRMYEAVDRCPAPVIAPVQRHVARRRHRARLLLRRGRRGRGRRVRVLRGQARDHPGGDLAVRAGADRRRARRGATSSRASGSTRSTALRIGLVHEVVPAGELDAAVDRIVAEILSAGPEAARHAKRLVLDAPLDGLETARRIAERRTSDEGQEGLRAFLERRPPGWIS